MSLEVGKSLADGTAVVWPVEALRRHLMVLGSTGSGKTVLCKCVVEEAVRNGVPVIAVDPQGDIASLAVVEDPAKLAEAGVPTTVQQEFFSKARTVIFTPASTKGIPLSVNPLKLPQEDTSPEESVLAIDLSAASLAAVLGYDLTTPAGKGARAYLFVILEHLFKRGRRPSRLSELVDLVAQPPTEVAAEVAALLPAKDAEDLARKMRYLTVGAPALLFEMGMQLDMDAFLDRSDGKVPLNIIYLNSLTSDIDKQFFLTMLLREVYLWMLKHPSKDLQLLLFIDEIAPYIPPYPRSPPPKEAYALLFKQARKYGIGLAGTTQNVTDIDYKALGQVNTWCLGRLMMPQDIARVQRVIQAIDPTHAEYAINRLPSLKASEFLLLSPDIRAAAVEFRVRWLLSHHSVLDENDFASVIAPEARGFFEKYLAPMPKAPPEAPAAPALSAKEKEVLEPKVAEVEPSIPEPPPAPVDTAADEKVRDLLTSLRKAVSAREIAGGLQLPSSTVGASLDRLATAGVVATGRAAHGKEDLFWLSEYGFQPSQGIDREVLSVPMRIAQVDVVKQAGARIGGLLFKGEEVVNTRLSDLPLWKVTCSRTSKSLFVPHKEFLDDYYVNALTGAVLTVHGKEMRFETIVHTAAEGVQDLDDIENVTFVPKVPGELEALPSLKFGAEDAFRRLRTTFGVEPRAAQLALLPVWNLDVRAPAGKGHRTLVVDAVSGRTVKGTF